MYIHAEENVSGEVNYTRYISHYVYNLDSFLTFLEVSGFLRIYETFKNVKIKSLYTICQIV